MVGAQLCFACGQGLSDPVAAADEQNAPEGRLAGSDGTARPLQPGQVLRKRYLILRQLGRGGFGSVYQAQDRRHRNRLVAIKEIVASHLDERATAEAIGAFHQEASLLSALRHPGLPQVYEYFSEQGCCYLVMQFIEGETLDVLMSREPGGRLSLTQVLDVACQLCDVLEYLHTRPTPIVFRDVKPENVMLERSSGRVYLIDFGIARRFKPGQSRDTMALGSPGYAAPEQYGAAQSTPQADIYGLGATLHHLLTGCDPSERPLHFDALRVFDHSLPPALDRLIARMVRVEVQRRPASIAEVRAELERIRRESGLHQTGAVSGRQVQVLVDASGGRQPLPQQPARPLAGQRLKRRTVLLVTSSLLLGGLAGLFVGERLARVTGQQAGAGSRPASPATTPATLTVTTRLIYSAHQAPISALAFSGDGQYLASGDRGHSVHVWEPSSGQDLFTYTQSAPITALAWAGSASGDLPSNSALLASSSEDGSIQVWDAFQQSRVLTYRGHQGAVLALKADPFGRLVSAGADGSVQIWDALTGQRLLTLQERGHPISALAWSPDAVSLACGDQRGTISLWDTGGIARSSESQRLQATYVLTDPLSGLPVSIHALAWSYDAATLACAGERGVLTLISLGMNAMPPVSFPPTEDCYALAWSPRGDLLLLGQSTQACIVAASVSSSHIFCIYHPEPGAARSLDWSPRSGLIASSVGEHVYVWSVSPALVAGAPPGVYG
jgi:hypothetical protein